GGVCVTWDGKIARIADDVPAFPIALVPEATVSTQESRAALPPSVAHTDAAFNVARAALLGAALARGSDELFASALDDRLHEPYRAGSAPLLGQVRERLPAQAYGATLSGSGPTVIVWAKRDALTDCVRELADSFPDTRVTPLEVSGSGAEAVTLDPGQ